MAYQTGTVNSLADIQTVIRTFLVDNGWTWDAGSSTIYKDTVFVEMSIFDNRVLFRASTSLGAGYSGYVAVGGLRVPTPTLAVTFPATYRAFLADDEFYFVVNYDVTRYQFVTFGKSTVDLSDSGGVGTFLSATGSSSPISLGFLFPINTSPSGEIPASGTLPGLISAGPFFSRTTPSGNLPPASFVHSNLDGGGWELRDGYFGIGNSFQGNTLGVLPNQWNGESPLLPIRAYKARSEGKISLVLDLRHARQCRVDNFNDAEVITIGSDQWQVFPHHRRNASARDGGTANGNGMDHTGTFGWAIRKVD